MRRIIAVAVTLSLLLAGCAALQNKNELREQNLEGYAAALRWGDFAQAWSFVDPKLRDAQPLTAQQKASYDSVRVAEYQASAPVATGEDTIEQTARISLIDKSSQRVYTISDPQRWRWDPAAKRWWLESGLPDLAPPGAH